MYLILIPLFIVFLLNFVLLLIFMHKEYTEIQGLTVKELKSNYADLKQGLKFALNSIKLEIATELVGYILFYSLLPTTVLCYYIGKYKINKEYFKRIEEMI